MYVNHTLEMLLQYGVMLFHYTIKKILEYENIQTLRLFRTSLN